MRNHNWYYFLKQYNTRIAYWYKLLIDSNLSFLIRKYGIYHNRLLKAKNIRVGMCRTNFKFQIYVLNLFIY